MGTQCCSNKDNINPENQIESQDALTLQSLQHEKRKKVMARKPITAMPNLNEQVKAFYLKLGLYD